MLLRSELIPSAVDEVKVRVLTELASSLDGALEGTWAEDLAEFNRVSGTDLSFQDFQGIYGAEDHQAWVARLLVRQAIRPVEDVTLDELIEVVRRAMIQIGSENSESYMAIFEANVPRPGASNLIFYPTDYNPSTNTWDGGRPISEYDPTPEDIVKCALTSGIRSDQA